MYTILKRSKQRADVFAFMYKDALLSSCNTHHLYRAFKQTFNSHELQVDVVWRDGTRTVETLITHLDRHFAAFDTAVNTYTLRLALRAQGVASDLSVPVDVRCMFDDKGPMIAEIRIDNNDANRLLSNLQTMPDPEEEEDDWVDEDDDDIDSSEVMESLSYEEETVIDRRKQIADWGERAPDWAVTLSDTQVEEIYDTMDIDDDSDLPVAEDLKEEWF